MNAVIPTRRSVLALSAAPLLPVGQTPTTESRILALCREYFVARDAVAPLNRALVAALEQASRLQVAVHEAEDLPGEILEDLEAMPATTRAEALAKVEVARALVREGIDPMRHEFLAAVMLELQKFGEI